MDRDSVLVGLALAAFIILGPAMCGDKPSPPGPVLLVGDSLLFQSSDEIEPLLREDGWEVIMEPVLGSGIAGGGDPPVDWSQRLDELADQHDPELVVIELGTNGCGPGCTSLEEEIDDLLDQLSAVDVVLWMDVRTDAPHREDPAAINAALQEAANDHNDLTILPYQEWLAGDPNLVAIDGVHLSAAGQIVVADHLREAIRDHSDVD